MSKRKNLKISTLATILIVFLTNSVFNNYFINLPEPSEKPIESHSSDLIDISTNNFENINTINSENVKYDVKQLNSPEETSKKKETLEFTIPIPQLNMEEIINPEGETFNRLNMEDMYYLGQEGRPRLPVKTLQILLPYGKDLDDINIELGTPTIFEINHEIEPVQEQIPLGSNRKPEFKYETQIYDSSSPFPGNYYSIEGIHELRGYRILILNVYPVQYIPKTGELHSYEDVKVKINLNEGPKNLPLFRSLDNDEDRVRAVVDNPEELISYHEDGDSRLDLPGRSYDYVIITNEALKNSIGMYTFQDLAAYKNACGIMTTIVTVEEIYANYSGVDDQEKIRNFIIDAYNNWGIEYVLLGGDGDGSAVGGESEAPIIPNRGFYCSGPSETDTNMPADLYYAALDGNWNSDGDSYWGEVGEEDFYAEVYVGRAPVDSEIELSNFIMKTLQHETTAAEYMSKALMVGEDLGWSVWGGEYKDEVRNGASTNGYTTVGFPSEFTVDTLYDMDAVWSKNELINIMNDGVHVINHLGHANVGSVMKMSNNDVDTLLTNTNYFFAYSQGCYDGSFDNRDTYSNYLTYDCIAEHFVNTPNGAFAFIGNSRYGWGNRYTTDGASQHFDREFFDAIFSEGIAEIGKANQDSKEDNVGFMSESYIRWCYYELNLFGDPTASILPQPNNYAPSLSSESVSPKTGYQNTLFNFSVVYTDADNNAPSAVDVVINGTEHRMERSDISDINYTDGCLYQYLTYLDSSSHNYSYFFECTDGKYYNATTIYNDIKVEESNIEAPRLLNPQFTPSVGINSTIFNFTVEYFDSDNNPPSIVGITINDIVFSMLPVNPLDDLALDGIKYYFETMLDYGYYQFQMNCSDGGFTNSTELINGPEVNPFMRRSHTSLFIDDFEDQMLNPEWSVDYGIASIDDAISNSGSYSLAIAANGGSGTSVTSRVIDLSGYNELNLSMWITSGYSTYSEPPDSGENLYIYYYNNVGNWELLDTFLGADLDPQTYTPTYNLPADAYHADFRIRFSHNGGTMTTGDYWHVDDVGIPFSCEVNLLAPNNSEIIHSESADFEWTSLTLPHLIVNYSLQISDTTDFSSLIYSMSGITETPTTTQVSILLSFPVNQYYWRVQPTYGPFSGNWTDYFTFNLCTNDFEPQLLEGKVDPCSGNQFSSFNFSVIYYDSDNSPPVYVNVIINGTSFTMEKVNKLDNYYVDGCAFDYVSPLEVSEFNYTYSFECYDGISTNSTAIYNNLEVIEVNYVAPYLFNPQLTPTSGINSTMFNFTVEYFDEDNNAPLFVNIEINNSLFSMIPLDLGDNYAIDGIQYYFETTLDYEYYQFQMTCSDGGFTNITGWINGPEVNPFLVQGGSEVAFEYDFEDQILDPDWSVDFGIASINDMISNSGSYSLAIAANGGSGTRVTSRVIDLSAYNDLNLSLWITSGYSDYSEPPDSGENLHILYYNNLGSWVLLDTFLGVDSDPQTYTPFYNLPADAYHAGFRIRLLHSGGTMTAGDYWHIDDIRFIGPREIHLLSPNDNELMYSGSIDFEWTSLMLTHALVNYTLQISNTSDFSNHIYSVSGITETPGTTNISLFLNIPVNQYYWRVRPTYGPFSGSWTDNFSFIMAINEFNPYYSDIITPTNNDYAPNADYIFNCTWFDNDGSIEEVLLEFNAQNYTVNSNFAGEFTHTLSNLAANEIGYNFRWHSRDNADAWNSSNWNLFVLHKQSVQLNLTFNGKENNWFLAKYISINITVDNLDLTPGILRLYVDNKSKQETVSALLSYSKVFSSGEYNITAILTDENYTGYIMKWLIIKKPIQTDGNPNPGIPGYDILLLLGAIGVVSFVVVKKRLIRMKT